MKFTKMHGIGNDYIYIDCTKETIENPEELAPLVSDRHKGIGGDGLILRWPCIMPMDLMERCAGTGSAVWRNMCMTTG